MVLIVVIVLSYLEFIKLSLEGKVLYQLFQMLLLYLFCMTVFAYQLSIRFRSQSVSAISRVLQWLLKHLVELLFPHSQYYLTSTIQKFWLEFELFKICYFVILCFIPVVFPLTSSCFRIVIRVRNKSFRKVGHSLVKIDLGVISLVIPIFHRTYF